MITDKEHRKLVPILEQVHGVNSISGLASDFGYGLALAKMETDSGNEHRTKKQRQLNQRTGHK